ncbi:hypothetical protein EPICR_10220 [Candidatus Desulfarcum epimagneticum]|uniref:RHS repeat-associated core domain-containing protein n=1 Tax=uncultured Desulfobacteraceae bacterium TaxID=218296 RepID=A0A484HBP1_9BACT|nr:hypothetical protein EPICR_10220 [uncultured Desulfobacteraceae bacterium]
MTNGLGDVEEKMAYAPFGSPRSLDGQAVDFSLSFTNRGFTGHEHIDDMGIIHMNGRVYDPEIGRFLSPDGFIQDPYSSQSFNRYTYCLNNPLQYTDPSGHFFSVIAAYVASISFAAVAKAVVVGAVIGAAVGGTMAAINGGDVLEGMKGGAISGAISGAIFGGIHFIPGMGEVGTAFSSFGQAMVHGAGGALSGAISASISGSDLGMAMVTGAIGAGVAKYVGGKFFHGKGFPKELAGRTLVDGATGGIGAEIYGGDFGEGFTNGAASSAIGFLCNDLLMLLKPMGAKGAGHLGVAIGNDENGWYYFSKDGRENGGDVNGYHKYDTKAELLEAVSVKYDLVIEIPATAKQDWRMIDHAWEHLEKPYNFNLLNSSERYHCADFAIETARVGGVNVGGNVLFNRPNGRFWEIHMANSSAPFYHIKSASAP